jgi:catechol 2,3-dioxygenase-like lactoylglutathione lyase family enzyme
MRKRWRRSATHWSWKSPRKKPDSQRPASEPDFWIGGEGKLERPVHIAIVAKERLIVDAFHRAALAAGGKDNGAPGLRSHYHPNYYAAFVLDPDGHNIEAVCHTAA